VLYELAKIQLKYLVVLSVQKWQNLIDFKFCTVHTFRCQILSFLPRQVLELIFCSLIEHLIIYIWEFVLEFFETLNAVFFKKKGICVAQATGGISESYY
jgi:hypothetical protein